MSAPILLTKLFVPAVRPELVSRPHLIDQLNHGLHRKLTLISAPAGFGKTTVVTDWLQSQGDDASSPFLIGWLSLDEDDNDPVRFLTYLIATLNRLPGLETAIGSGALQMAQSSEQPPPETILIAVMNDIALLSEKIVLVLDDYHLIDSQPIHDALTFLLENFPPQMHLVITTREDPPIPISRLRARGHLNELRALDLRFTSEETANFLNQVMGLNLSAADIVALEMRTEGWIAGLQLAAISMQGLEDTAGFIQSFTGSNRMILDYLIEEVLIQQSEGIQAFLLQTSILNHLTGSLCDALTGQDDGQATLEMLERANLFIVPLDDERHWYRYHHLFADLLRQRLRQKQPDLTLTLHCRASEWYEQNGFVDETIEHALRSEKFERAKNLIEDYIEVLWGRGEHNKLQLWLDGLPEEILFSSPSIAIFQARCQYNSGQLNMAERTLNSAEKSLGNYTDRTTGTLPIKPDPCLSPDRKKQLGRIAVIRALLAFFYGDVPGIIRNSHQALAYLPEQDFAWRSSAATALGDAHGIQGELDETYRARLEALEISKTDGNLYVILIASMKLAVTMRHLGQLEQVIEICMQQVEQASESGLSQTGVVGGFLAIWGEAHAEMGDLDGAFYRSQQGVELAECGDDMVILGWSYLCLIRVLFTRRDITGAEQLVQKIVNKAHNPDIPPWITKMISAWQVRIWLAQNKLDAASRWILECGLDGDVELLFLSEIEHIVLARTFIAQGRLDEAIELLQHLFDAAETGGRKSKEIEILIIQSLAYQAGNDTDQAVSLLEKALRLAKPSGFICTFVDEGPPMARLLYDALSRGIAPDYVQRLLAAFPVEKPDQMPRPQPQSHESEWIERLSDRELEVLRLIAEGLSRSEIAAKLVLSLNTIKTHTRNIYSKLGVNNQMQAVGKARALGLLENE